MPRKRREKRPVGSYLESAKALARFAPSLKKYAKRKRLSAHEKAAITRKENWLRYVDRLIPVTESQAKIARRHGYLYEPEKPIYARDKNNKIIKDSVTGHRIIERMEPIKGSGIRAVRLLGTGNDLETVKLREKEQRTATVHIISPEMILETNGRHWLFQGIPFERRAKLEKDDPDYSKIERQESRRHAKRLDAVARSAFENVRAALPIEEIAELAKRAFKRPKVLQIHLWTRSGRVGRGFRDYASFLDWLQERFVKYRETDEWVNGLAIELT